jgi:CheY-like chemotaxis protein
MATGLEGLLKQLTDKMTNVTPSTMRTISGAVDLIGNLCAPSLKSDLATNPPIRLLAVDDDRISRNVISFALKKSLHQPDLAEDGKAALVLAENGAYDVIFLDIQMPAMDGFELCKRIHSTNLNRQTPVVFVTCQSDFEARAQAALVGGLDLIAKPYLTFEIALKALTMVLRRRLGPTQAAAVPSAETVPALGETAAAEQKTEPAPAIVSNSAKADRSTQAASPALPEQANPAPRSRRSARNRRARRRHSKIQRRLAGTTGA